MGKINLHIYPSSLSQNESRILKITSTTSVLGIFEEVYLLGMIDGSEDKIERLDETRLILRLGTNRLNFLPEVLTKALRFSLWTLRAYLKLMKEEVSCVNPHSLSSLPLACLFKFFKGSRIVYDTHELETETIRSTGVRKVFAKILEKSLIRFVDHIVVVNDEIGSWYKENYQIENVTTVRNIPYRSTSTSEKENNLLRERYSIAPDEIIFIYQGILCPGRGIELLLQVFSDCNPIYHIVFLGFGELESLILGQVKNNKNIHFHPKVPSSELLRYTNCADVGISLIENACLSYYLSLPNKVLEYLSAGVPAIVSDFPEMGKLIDESEAGWKSSVDILSLSKLLSEITIESISVKQEKALLWSHYNNWEIESRKLLEIYSKIFPDSAQLIKEIDLSRTGVQATLN